jgi:methylmalonyl-CoA mutase
MNSTKKTLFQDFNPVTKQEWIDKVNIDLKGADFNKTLVWKNLSNIEFQPFYTKDENPVLLKNTGENAAALVNYRSITVTTVESANTLALKAVAEGMTGLLFIINAPVLVEKLLKGINLNEVTISFNLNSHTVDFAKDYMTFVEASKVTNLKGFINSNLITNYVSTGNLDENHFNIVADLIKATAKYPNFKALTVSGNEYLNAGANQVQEVAYTLNSLVFIIEKLVEKGITVQAVFDNLNFDLAIGAEYFIEIGKFRAFNNLLNEVAAKYGVTSFSNTIIGKTAIWNKSITDAHTNLLRATTEAMSAILGNVDGVLIDAYDKEFKDASDFSSRIAGNITTILKEESYFGKVSNPVDGSYYIEEVTSKIAEKALELFKAIEANGGFYASFESELIQQQIAEIRQEKIKLLSQRRSVLVGVNKYPNLMEKVASSILSSGDETSATKVLKPRRAALEIEAIRKTTEELVEKTGVRPVVELASFGNLTMRKARAAFSYDFIGVSGFNVQQEKSFASAQIAAEESAKSASNVVVICSSDPDYDESALDFIKTFRKINTSKVLLLAGAPANINELIEAGLDGCVNMRSDVIATISSIQQKVQKTINS